MNVITILCIYAYIILFVYLFLFIKTIWIKINHGDNMPINNIFDFIDYLEAFNRDSGTANENRAFVYNSLSEVFEQLDSSLDLYSAYVDIGIIIPQNTFDNIIELIGAGRTNGNMVQAFAPTSLLPLNDLPCFSDKLDDAYIVYSKALVFNPITGDSSIEDWYHTFNYNMTTSQLREQTALSLENHPKYGVVVSSLDLLRIYQRC